MIDTQQAPAQSTTDLQRRIALLEKQVDALAEENAELLKRLHEAEITNGNGHDNKRNAK